MAAATEHTAAATVSTAAATVSTAAPSIQAVPPQAVFINRFSTAPDVVEGINLETFTDADGGCFEGVVCRDALSVKRLVVWSERTVHLNERTMTQDTHIRAGQGNDVMTLLQNRHVEGRPKLAKGGECRPEPPTIDDMAVAVKLAKARAEGLSGGAARAAAAAAGAALTDTPDTEDLDDDDGPLHFEEVSTVTAISLAAVAASQASQASRRLPARTISKRPRQVTPSLGGSTTSSRGSRGNSNIERFEGSGSIGFAVGAGAASSYTEDVQSEIDKLSIFDILSCCGKTTPSRMPIYNGVQPSVILSLC